MDKIQRAEALFAGGFNCCQSVLAAFAPELGMEEAVALKLCSSFGSGARNGELCGAVSGALMALGLKYGYDVMDEAKKQRVCALAVEFTSRFREENGSIRCEELLGYDVKKPEDMAAVREKQLFKTFCPKLVKSAAEILRQMLKAPAGEETDSGCCATGCCTGSCCGEQTLLEGKKPLKVTYLYLDLNTCDRCIGTDAVLEEVLEELRPALTLAGYTVTYEKQEITNIELAEQYRFLSSPTILVNGQDIFGPVQETDCGCCGEIAGTAVDCRAFEHEGVLYEVPTKAMVADAILKSLSAVPACCCAPYTLPENLKRFFEGKTQKAGSAACQCGSGCCGNGENR